MEAGEEQQVCDLVVRVFSDFVAPLYSPEGVHEFLTYAADHGQLRSRLLANRFVLVADLQGRQQDLGRSRRSSALPAAHLMYLIRFE